MLLKSGGTSGPTRGSTGAKHSAGATPPPGKTQTREAQPEQRQRRGLGDLRVGAITADPRLEPGRRLPASQGADSQTAVTEGHMAHQNVASTIQNVARATHGGRVAGNESVEGPGEGERVVDHLARGEEARNAARRRITGQRTRDHARAAEVALARVVPGDRHGIGRHRQAEQRGQSKTLANVYG